MARRYYLDDIEMTDVTVTGRPRTGALEDGLVSSAYGGDTGTSGQIIDDPSGVADIKGFARFAVDEDDCTPARIWTGYIGARRIWQSDQNSDGTGRVFDCDLWDLNVLLGFRVCRGIGAKRPAETDVERVKWLLDTTFMIGAGPGIFDNGFVSSVEPHPYDEADYRKEYPAQVIDSVIGRTKTYWVYWDADAVAGEEVSLFYGKHDTVFGDLTVKLSNDPDDPDPDSDPQTVFAALDGQQVNRNPEDTYSGILFDWKGADIYRQLESTVTTFGVRRDLLYSTDRVGLASTASTQTDRLLVAHSVERDTLTCVVHLKSSQVNWFREGWRVQVKFTHLPGYTTYTWLTIQKRTVRLVRGTYDRYEVALEMTSDAPEGSGFGGGDPGDFPLPPSTCDATTGTVVQSVDGAPSGTPATITLPSAPTQGNTIIVFGQTRQTGKTPSAPIGFADAGAGIVSPSEATGAAWYRVVQSGDTAAIVWPAGAGSENPPELVYVDERIGQFTPEATSLVSTDPYSTNSPFPGAAITPDSGRVAAIVGYMFMKRNNGDLAAGTGWTLLDAQTVGAVVTHGVIDKLVTATSGTYTPSFTGANPAAFDNHSYGAITLALTCSAVDFPPGPGQWVIDEVPSPTPDGSTTTFTVDFTFADGSLTVKVDLLDQTGAVTSYDGAAGTFTLGFAPVAGELVEVTYQGR